MDYWAACCLDCTSATAITMVIDTITIPAIAIATATDIAIGTGISMGIATATVIGTSVTAVDITGAASGLST